MAVMINTRRIRLTVMMSAVSLLLSACASVPPPETNAVLAITEGQWHSELPQGITVNDAADLSLWWQRFNDPLLNRLVEETLANNPDLEGARITHRLALLQAGVSDSNYLPKAGVNAGVQNSRSDDSDSTSYSVGANASWELDLWGTGRAASRAAEAGVDAAAYSLRDAQVSLIADSASAYISLREAQANIAAAQANIQLRQESYDLADVQYRSGMVTELEVAQAKTLLAQTQATLPQYQQARDLALNQIRVLIGGERAVTDGSDSLNSEFMIQLQQVAPLPQYERSVTLSLPADTLRQRPDVRALEFSMIQQAQLLRQAEGQRFPSLTLSGSLASSSANSADLFSADSVVRALAASLSYTLFDGGVLKTNERTQALQLDKSLQSYRAGLLTAQQEVEDALSALNAAQQQQGAYLQAEESALLAESLARAQYDAGLLDFDELLTAQSSLLTARNSRIQNEGALLSDWVQLYRSAGGGLPVSAVNDRVTDSQDSRP